MDEEQQEKEQTPAEVMQGMRDEYEKKLAEKDKEIANLKTQHAREVRDILTGKNPDANKRKNTQDRIKEAAQKIRKNLGV